MSVTSKIKSEYVVFLAGMLLILLLLSRYIVNGEPVDVRSEITGETVMLSDGMELTQPLTISEGSNWRQGYYAIFFSKSDGSSEGEVVCTLRQGEWQEVQRIPLQKMTAGEWIPLSQLAFHKLSAGEAELSVRTENVAAGELEAAVGPDYYGFGNCSLNGDERQAALAQAYHYHRTGVEYKVRLLCFGVVVLCAAALFWLVYTDGTCLAAFGILTVMFLAMIYLLDSSVYLEPTYAEAVTNFLHFAREEKLTANLLITDAGYLPLLPRLITLFYLKALRMPSSLALYFMQGTACLLCSMVWSFFVLGPFRGLMRLSNRILLCILVMLSCFCEETIFFTNHAYWGIYLLLLLLVADLEAFPGWIYAGLLGASALICLSKGTYAVMLPLMVLYLLFFRKSLGKRDKVYACVVGIASMLQLLYSFGGQGDGGSWIDTSAMGQIGFWFRLAGRTFVEFGAHMLLPLGEAVSHAPVLVVIVAAVSVLLLAAGFIRKILPAVIHGERIERRLVGFYTVALFQLIVAAFFLVTVRPVPDSWGGIGSVALEQMGSKYEIFSDMGFYLLLVTGGALIAAGDRNLGSVWSAAGHYCRDYGILALMLFFCLTNPVMRFGGWTDAVTSDGRIYAGSINAGWQDCKDIITSSSFFIPVRNDNWAYSRSINLYQAGTEDYFEETSCKNLEETLEGYHDSYEIKDAAQAQNLIEVMIDRPMRVDRPSYRVKLLDADGSVIAEAGQLDSGRNKKCLFRFEEPVSGVRTIQFTDDTGNPVFFQDYIAWACAY